jgi:TP901 family phage tail tape measure protein
MDDVGSVGIEVDSSGVRRASDDLGGLGRASIGAARAIAGLVAGFLSLGAAMAAVEKARLLNGALAETATLLTGMPGEIDRVAASARNLADAYGTSDEAQVRAFYQAISGGASNAADATLLLDAANKLAIGGVTDVTSATGILTTAINVFSAENQTAADASDALFVAMKAGVTTIPELAAALGAVLPFSQSLGVSFDETAAAVAALTKGGLTTSVATNGLRAALTSILAPTEMAKELAETLGIEFNAAGLEAKGLAGFLEQVTTATGGSNTKLQQLFGSTEATAVALGFAGSAGESFTEILEQMNNKLGATDEAMAAVALSASNRMDNAIQAVSNTFIRLALTTLPLLATGLESLSATIDFVIENTDIFAIALGVLAASRITALVAGLYASVTAFIAYNGIAAIATMASTLLGIAMKAIPFVAAVAGLTLIYRALSSTADFAQDAEDAFKGFSCASDGRTRKRLCKLGGRTTLSDRCSKDWIGN